MAVLFVEIQCDWPNCEARLRINWQNPQKDEFTWYSIHGHIKGPHLCPKHKEEGEDGLKKEHRKGLIQI